MKKNFAGRQKNWRQRQKGATLLEAMVALCFLCFFFFSLLQIYQWCTAKLFCRYASYYGAKGRSLGYKTNFVLRAIRVAALPISGSPGGLQSRSELRDAQNYMVDGDASGVWYRYWYPQRRSDPMVILRGNHQGQNVHATVTLRNAPLLAPELGKLMGIAEHPDPAGSSRFYNYADIYLEDNDL